MACSDRAATISVALTLARRGVWADLLARCPATCRLLAAATRRLPPPTRAEVARWCSQAYHTEGERISYYAGYSRASATADVAQQLVDLGGVKKPVWLTEFQAGLDPPSNCLMPNLIYGALHGVFHVARILAAINMPGSYDVLTFQTFVQPRTCVDLGPCPRTHHRHGRPPDTRAHSTSPVPLAPLSMLPPETPCPQRPQCPPML